jgi:hypothetical protein
MDMSQFSAIVITFVVVAVIIGIGGTILQSVQEGQCADGAAWNATIFGCNADETTIASNATGSGLTGIDTFGDWLPTIAVIVAAAVVIGVIVNYFRA